ncbi:MAG TPA: D-aminoacylase [Symbiobacteriaceae bacterium]|nr:D-aminoacylase [Symbiobacteriaceae bacterium]
MLRSIAAATVAVLMFLAGCSRGAQPPATPVNPGKTEPPPVQAAPAAYDLVIRGGTIIDGSGAAGAVGDIAIVGDKIVAVGKLGPYKAGREIDVAGAVVAPGFINPHSHTHDFINPFEDLDATASLMQGITTEFGGVDGRSPLPIGQELDRLTKAGTGVNFGLFVGQGSVRGSVMGDAPGAAGAGQLEAMKGLVRQGMEEGAFGVSTGLEYMPGRQAGQAEIAALVAEAKSYGGVYSTHMRSEGDQIVESLQEALAISRTAGVPLNLSHFKIVKYPNWGKEEQVVKLVEQAIGSGQQVFADVYPYLAPDYAINRPLKEWSGSLPADYIVITKAADPAMVGRTVAEVAKGKGWPAEQAADKLGALDPGLAVVALVSSEKAMLRFYQAPWSVVSTDGESQPKLGSPAEALAHAFHRRSYGSYPMLLGHYVREQKLMGLEAMVRKMTGAVADNLGVKDRGYLKPGFFADLVVFDPKMVADRTTWLSPQEYPAGIRHVFVNGAAAVQDGKRVAGRPGRALRHGK